MKRTVMKTKRELALKRKLQLVRTSLRELTPTQLDDVHGGCPFYTLLTTQQGSTGACA
jgi:hypothetical protein